MSQLRLMKATYKSYQSVTDGRARRDRQQRAGKQWLAFEN